MTPLILLVRLRKHINYYFTKIQFMTPLKTFYSYLSNNYHTYFVMSDKCVQSHFETIQSL